GELPVGARPAARLRPGQAEQGRPPHRDLARWHGAALGEPVDRPLLPPDPGRRSPGAALCQTLTRYRVRTIANGSSKPTTETRARSGGNRTGFPQQATPQRIK